MSQVLLRNATPDDVPAMAQVEAASWPAPLAADAEAIRKRIEVFPDGQWVAQFDGEVIGTCYAQRLSAEFFDRTLKQYDLLTDQGTFAASHDPAGSIFQLVGVGVARPISGMSLGRRMVDQQITLARRMPGIERIIGFTRPTGYHRQQDTPIDEYVHLEDRGHPIDRVLSFHLMFGAKIVSTHADFRPADEEACGYGVLIEYPVKGK